MRQLLFLLVLLTGLSGSAWAQEDKKTDDLKPADPDTGESTVEETTLGLLPNPFEKQGIKFAITYIGELIGNPTGGQKQSAVYEDRINFAVDADLEKLFGAKQLTFHANIFQIDGGGLSRGDLLNYMVVSGIEALPTTRLYEIWLRAKMGDQTCAEGGPARRRYRIHDGQIYGRFHQRFPGVACGPVVEHAERRPIATIGNDGDAASRRSHRTFYVGRGGIRWQCRRPGIERSTVTRPLWAQLPRQRSAVGARRDAIPVECGKGRSGPGGKVQGWRLAPFWRLCQRALQLFRSIPWPAWRLMAPRPLCPAISVSTPFSNRNFTALERTMTAVSGSLPAPHTARRTAT